MPLESVNLMHVLKTFVQIRSYVRTVAKIGQDLQLIYRLIMYLPQMEMVLMTFGLPKMMIIEIVHTMHLVTY